MQRRVTKAVFPVAGLGTRFLPATQSVPKEVLTLVDRPLIQDATREARAAGAPAARCLPAPKALPKEVLTLVDRPLIQYAIDEARAAGITDFIFVTAKGKSALEDYFDHATELETKLEADGKLELLEALRSSN